MYPTETLDAVTDGLAAASVPAHFAVARAGLRLAFGPERPGVLPVFGDLDPREQRFVRVLASVEEDAWRWTGFPEMLRTWGLPGGREGLRAYAGPPDTRARSGRGWWVRAAGRRRPGS